MTRTISFYNPITHALELAEVREEKRDALIHAGYTDADAILNVLHQAGWWIIPKNSDN